MIAIREIHCPDIRPTSFTLLRILNEYRYFVDLDVREGQHVQKRASLDGIMDLVL